MLGLHTWYIAFLVRDRIEVDVCNLPVSELLMAAGARWTKVETVGS